MSKSPYGNISRMNVEWSSKGRKEENDLRGLNHTARREAIAEQIVDLDDEYHGVDHLDEISEEILKDVLYSVFAPAGVTFNGNGFELADEYDWHDDYEGR